ncbi:hypothetical protein [Saccharicrinis aurantiacus]|uniref:hypothetical protein n=1 Tax=Saccharicrinis aurantiacus TaxID=1849719 RepID=UPI002490D573|nr:hypothetical protein [Saccharicrinis aurantiacus]
MTLSKKEQKIFSILSKDETQRNYFFRKVKDIKWFQPLYNEGFFDINKYPIKDTSAAKQGENIAWAQLLYIEELTTNFKASPSNIYITDLIKIVADIVNSNYINYWVDYRLNKILSLLPTSMVEFELLKKHLDNLEAKSSNNPINDHILITELLPAILNSGAPKKIELFISKIFQFKTYKNSTLGSVSKTTFDSSSLEYTLTKEYLSAYDISVIKTIHTQLMRILLPQMQELKDGTEIKFDIGQDEYSFKVGFTDQFSFKIYVSGTESFNFEIRDYNLKTQEQVFFAVTEGFSRLDLEKVKLHGFIGNSQNEITAPFKRLYLESYYISSYKFFRDKERFSSDDLTDILKIVVRLIELIYEKDEKNRQLFIEELLGDKYFFPFFKRAALSLICNNYGKHRKLFWSNIEKYNFLSSYKYDDDSFYLLDNNKENLSTSEIANFVDVIEVGPRTKDRDNYNQVKMYWQLKWYSLLQQQKKYKPKYNELKQKINKGKDFVWRPTGIVTITGSQSPIKIKELEQKTVNDTVNYLLTYKKDESDFTGPDEEGLSQVLKEVIINNPIKYIKEIELFKSVNNTYVYALTDALQNKVSDNYNAYILRILDFYYEYLNAPSFTYEKQEGEDYFRRKPGESIVREIFRLLKKLVSNNTIKFKKTDLDKVSELLRLSHTFLKPEHYKDDRNKDSYIMFAINNPQGMFYELVLELSLREGRDYANQNEKWQYKQYFNNAIANKNDSCLTILGRYFNNFLWLDKDWTLIKFQSLEIGSGAWKAFFGGHLPVNPVTGIVGYEAIRPSYEYLIKNNINYSISGGHGIGNHLFRLYYNDTIDLENGGLIDLYYSTPGNDKTELVAAILRYEESLKSLQGEEQSKLENKLTKLISFVTNKLIISDEDKDIKTLYLMFHLITLFKKLNVDIISSLLSIAKNVPIGNHNHWFLFNLVEYIKIDDSSEYANMLLRIYENLYEDLINTSIYTYTIDIWDFIMDKADMEGHKDKILEISKAFISRGDDRLEEYFTKLAEKIK